MLKIALFLLPILVLTASVALAKRSPPADVAPLRSGEIEFRVPHSQMGCVEAWDTKRDALIWRRQVYVVKYNVNLERDVQDVFITSVEFQKNTLLVTNERGSEYHLDLETLQVKAIKGPLIEQRK